jgi:hypothetical protein
MAPFEPDWALREAAAAWTLAGPEQIPQLLMQTGDREI